MLRALLFFVSLAVLLGIAWFLLDVRPGTVSLEWWGYRIDTSIGILLLALLLISALVALLYRFWRGLVRVPRGLGRSLERSRKRRGYRALTQGMVAVAAGEAEEARRWSRKADALLDEPPLTLLLAAQAAQLGGDDKAAERYFTAMLNRDETRFLGLRGLITQSLRDGDDKTALEHLRSAYRLRPRTPWVLTTLFDLSEKLGDLDGADKAVREAAKTKALPAPEATRKRAILLLKRAERARSGHDPALTLKLAREAHKLAPDLVRAATLSAELLAHSGRQRDAARLLERAWAAAPHPELVQAYREVRPSKDKIAWLGEVGKLVNGASRHPESLLALAEAALDANLWGEARRYLKDAADAKLTERVCRLMARLEDAEHKDSGKAREWLLRAADAKPDPLWVCGACGTAAGDWSARCGACDEFDSLAWKAPPRVAPAVLAPLADLPARADGAAKPPATTVELVVDSDAELKAQHLPVPFWCLTGPLRPRER
jgi:HemY protein